MEQVAKREWDQVMPDVRLEVAKLAKTIKRLWSLFMTYTREWNRLPAVWRAALHADPRSVAAHARQIVKMAHIDITDSGSDQKFLINCLKRDVASQAISELFCTMLCKVWKAVWVLACKHGCFGLWLGSMKHTMDKCALKHRKELGTFWYMVPFGNNYTPYLHERHLRSDDELKQLTVSVRRAMVSYRKECQDAEWQQFERACHGMGFSETVLFCRELNVLGSVSVNK